MYKDTHCLGINRPILRKKFPKPLKKFSNPYKKMLKAA